MFAWRWMILLAGLGLSFPCAAEESITIVADKWCPYSCAAEDANQGYMVDIVRAAFAPHNIKVEYKVMPWADALAKTRKGTFDAIVGASRNDAADFIFPDVVQGISINQFWVKKDKNWLYSGVPSLSAMRLGVVAGYAYSKELDAYIAEQHSKTDSQVQMVSDIYGYEFNIEKLIDGRVDVIVEDKNTIEYYFASRHLAFPLKSAGNPVDKNDTNDTLIYVAFGPNNSNSQRYAQILTAAMQSMRKSGELQAILNKYHMDEAYRLVAK